MGFEPSTWQQSSQVVKIEKMMMSESNLCGEIWKSMMTESNLGALSRGAVLDLLLHLTRMLRLFASSCYAAMREESNFRALLRGAVADLLLHLASFASFILC